MARLLTLAAVFAFSLTSLPAGGFPDHANPPVKLFSRIILLGDSLVDTGNAFLFSGGLFPPLDMYYQGRFSDGILWCEYLAEDWDLEILDYACGGAQTDDSNHNDGFLPFPLIGLTDEVALLLEDLGNHDFHPRDLVVVAVGANDFFDYLVPGAGGDFPYPSGVANTTANVRRLLDAGARHLFVWNVPDLANTPAFAGLPLDDREELSALIGAYNDLLATEMASLAREYRATVTVFDAYAVLNEIISNPAAFGLTNVTLPALFGGDPATSLFHDPAHPTTVGQAIIADFAKETIREAYYPRRHAWGQ